MKILLSICLCSLLTGMHNQYFYRRNLPHWFPRGGTIFVTWRLFDSLPPSSLQQLKDVSTRLQNLPTPPNTDPTDWELRKRKKIFAVLDSMLDQIETGPMWLKRTENADLIQQTLLTKYASLYTLWSYAIMSNHCHALLRPKLLNNAEPIPFETIMKRIKGYTAKEANSILGRTGKTFWQDESFDHWIRNEQEFERVVAYIENNPVKAGLVKRAEDWQWSSAAERFRRGSKEIISLT